MINLICKNYFRNNFKAPKNKKILFWLEIESMKKVEEYSDNTFSVLFKNKASLWQDGSVVTEIQTQPSGARSLINFYSKIHNDMLYSYKCWGHIHVSFPWIDNKKLFNNLYIYKELLYLIYPERKGNNYCDRDYYSSTKYKPFYAHSSGTLEVRYFPAIRSIDDLRMRFELIKFFIDNPITYLPDAPSISYNLLREVINKNFKRIYKILSITFNKEQIANILLKLVDIDWLKPSASIKYIIFKDKIKNKWAIENQTLL